MIALTVIAVIIILLLLALFLPLSVRLEFEDDFFAKVSFLKICVFRSDKKKKEKYAPKHTGEKQENEQKSKEENQGYRLFTFLKSKYGFTGAVKVIFGLLKDMLTHIKKLLRHIKIKRTELDITVAEADAAQTAIAYGKVCSVAYPVLSFLDSCANIGFKRINIKSDFNGKNYEFKFGATANIPVIFLLIAAYRVYSEYKKFIMKENFNERK